MLSPLELENRRVLSSKRKYDRFEVDEYLDLVFENYHALYDENEELKKQIKTLTEGIQYYRSIESTMQKALVLAEKTSKETKDAAILKAEAIEKDANNKAARIIGEAENEYDRIREKCVTLVTQFNQYKAQLQAAAREQLRLITSSTFDVDSPNIDEPMPAEPAPAPVSASSDTKPIPNLKSEDISSQSTPVTQTSPVTKQTFEEPVFEKPSFVQADEPVTTGAQAQKPSVPPVSETSVTQEPEPEIPVSGSETEQSASNTPVTGIEFVKAGQEPEHEPDISSQFEIMDRPIEKKTESVETPSETQDSVPDKTMVLPDVKAMDRQTLRGNRTQLTEDETKSILEADTINLEDSIRAVRNQQQAPPEPMEVPKQRPEPQKLILEPATEGTQPQGLDSILQNMTIGKKKNTNGVTEEDPFEFLGSVDDF